MLYYVADAPILEIIKKEFKKLGNEKVGMPRTKDKNFAKIEKNNYYGCKFDFYCFTVNMGKICI